MKRIFKYIALALVMPLAMAACTTDYPELDESALPEASEFDITIEVDNETNYVTFTLNNKGMVPMWIFGSDKVDDGKESKKYAYTTNGLRLRVRDAGTHTVEVKAYNANGVSIGAVIKEYTLENTYRDPFDAAPYMKAIEGQWMWNSEIDGHFGCGETIDNPLGWWSAPANDKADWSLYDDRMTFTADGQYSYASGDGYVYVHNASGYKPEYLLEAGVDYIAPIDDYTTTYSFENNWNDAGIEEIWLVMPEGANISYIPFPSALTDNGRYLVMDSNPATMRKNLKLSIYTATENDGSSIAWHYNFIPAVHKASPQELLAGTDANGKVWVMDSNAQGHLGCGESPENAANWWSAGANEKAGFGMYDDEVTFYPDGKYVYNAGPDGNTFVNFGVTALNTTGATADFDLAIGNKECTYVFDGEYITLEPNVPLIYVPSDPIWNNPYFKVIEVTESTLHLVAMNEGCYWNYILRARDYEAPGATIDGVDISSGMAELTLAQGSQLAVSGIDLSTKWIDPDFFEQVDDTTLKFLAVDGDYRIHNYDAWLKVVPLYAGEKATYENAKALWIIGDGGGKPTVDNLIGWNTGDAPLPCAQINDNTYRITLAMKAEGGSIKVFGQSDWGTEWTADKYGTVTDNGMFNIPASDGNIHTMPGVEPGYYTFTFVDNGGILDMSVAKYKKTETIYDPAAPENLWLASTNTMEYFYATTDAWTPVDEPIGFEENGNQYTISLPVATVAQWQAQVKYHTTMSSAADKTYDFYVVLNSNLDHPGVTIKLTDDADDGVFYFADRHPLTAYEDYVYKVPNMPGLDIAVLQLVLDFGGCEAGTEVVVKDILFQEHREQ